MLLVRLKNDKIILNIVNDDSQKCAHYFVKEPKPNSAYEYIQENLCTQ